MLKKKVIASLSVVALLGSPFAGNFIKANEMNYGNVVETTSVVLTDVSFKDVTKKSYAYDAIMYLAKEGIVAGYGNGYFGLKDNVTRGQVAALISRYKKLDTGKGFNNPYTDVKGNPFERAILAVTNEGYMSGKGKGKFDPNATLTRAEMAVVLTNVFDLKVKANYDFRDMDESHWANNAVRALYSNGLTFGSGDYKYNPNGKVTREQYAEFLYRGIHLDEDFEAEPIPNDPKKPSTDEVTGFTFGFNVDLEVGQSETLKLLVKYKNGSEKDVTSETNFEVENTKIVKLENGKIKAVGAGTTTLIAKYKDHAAKSLITVKEQPKDEPEKPSDPNEPIVVTSDFYLEPVNIKGFLFKNVVWSIDTGNKNPEYVSTEGIPLKPVWEDEVGVGYTKLPSLDEEMKVGPGKKYGFANDTREEGIYAKARTFIITYGADLTKDEFINAVYELQETGKPVIVKNYTFSLFNERKALTIEVK